MVDHAMPSLVRGAFARGELDTAGEIRRRFVAGRAARAVSSPAAVAAARAAAQAAGVAHMGAHALGAAAYAAHAAPRTRRCAQTPVLERAHSPKRPGSNACI
jgi:hypothetical protein